jgi:putative endonuclease
MPKKRACATDSAMAPITDSDKRRLWRKLLGDIGEQIVVQFLELNHWRIVCRKFRIGRSPEVDIIAISPDGITVFIEVKTRTIWLDSVATWHESAIQSVDLRKQKRVISASRGYRLANFDYDLSHCRYDIFLVGLSHKLASNLVNLKMDAPDSSLWVDMIDLEIANIRVGETNACLALLHFESAFVTNF